ncbi:major facilitator superfamily transporter [Colletotrichum graminicola]|uniref:Major facilitator superfamily transporter n=1 Tax=Colletotrichum graminicola (strain M1.001 / M2 / FGSC 10212) TaxID=645133 RepID=E3QTE8_COLGM|nr:major facilitator superfamily transporter [Colletotrichum graminicola M1.001]EFQ34136.1 major facilitator superfamily transporter [Colletotrichum graminicola M1.001]WDK18420.1 major facilitator superfamily transporter [Colletotrichum graminicola]
MNYSPASQPSQSPPFHNAGPPANSRSHVTAWPRENEKIDHGHNTPSTKYNDDTRYLESMQSPFDAQAQAQEGALYRDGKLILQPAPTQDPRDPLNLPLSRKLLACFCLSCFGALAAAAELILGAMLPVFALEYAGIDPKLLKSLTASGGLPANTDPLKYLSMLPNAPPIIEIYLLASLPVLVIGLSNLLLVPMAISVGRRPVVLTTGVIAIMGCIWAGNSRSLPSHLLARCVQAVGAGTVESLIPFVLQDMIFVHQRNSWISGVFAAQGVIIIVLGVATPQIIIDLSWRYMYFITAAGAAFFLIGVFFFMPETRWERTRAEMNGVPRNESGYKHAPRTFRYNIAFFHGEVQWRKGWNAFIDTLRTFFYPHIFFITMLNSVMIACAFAAGYTVAPALLTAPWSWNFLLLGLSLVPVLVAAIAVALVTGKAADWVANRIAKKRGVRLPENQLVNIIFPTLCGIIGSVIFGLAGSNQKDYSYFTFLTGFGMMAFGFLGANTIGAVYVLECYPHLAGPALVNVASFRCLLAFILSFKISDWVVEMGYFHSMMIYTGLISAFALLIPVVYIYGPAWRRRWPADHFGDDM